MKTNTNTLRRALETFAKTGKITLTASALMALALAAPVNADETYTTISDTQTLTPSTASQPAGIVVSKDGNLTISGYTQASPLTLTTGPEVGFRAGQYLAPLLVKGTAQIYGYVEATGSKNGIFVESSEGTASLTISDGGYVKAKKYFGIGATVDTNGKVLVNGGTLHSVGSLQLGSHGTGQLELTSGTVKTENNFQIASDSSWANGYESFGRSNGKFNMTGGNLEVGGSVYLVMDHPDAQKDHSLTETKNTAEFTMSGGTANITGSFNIASYSGDIRETTNMIDASATISGGKLTIGKDISIGNFYHNPLASTMTISDNAEVEVGGSVSLSKLGVLNVSGGTLASFSTPTSPEDVLAVSGGTMNLSGGTIVDTLALSNDATLNYTAGALTTLDMTNSSLNILDHSVFDNNAATVTNKGGSSISVNVTGSGSTSNQDYSLLTSTTFSGFGLDDIYIVLDSTGDNVGKLFAVTSIGDKGITYSVYDGKVGLYSGASYKEAAANMMSELTKTASGDTIQITDNITETGTFAVPESLTIRSNNNSVRTITADGTSALFKPVLVQKTDANGNLVFEEKNGAQVPVYVNASPTLTLENIKITGAYSKATCVYGSVIKGGNWTIIGGEFADNKTYGYIAPTTDSDHVAHGGAVYGGTIDLQNVKFTGNIVKANDEVFRTDPEKNTMSVAEGGAVYARNITLSGTSTFSGNKAISGNVTDTGRNRKDPAIGGALATGGTGDAALGQANIGVAGVKDTILFQGNEAISGSKNTSDMGGSIGGAVGADDYANVNVTAEKGDSIKFIENKASSEQSRAIGGAIGAGRNSYAASVTVQGSLGGEILFQNNTAENTQGTHPAMGGAIFSNGKVVAGRTVFDGNQATLNVTEKTKDAADSHFDDATITSASGGAIAAHNNYTYAGTEDVSVHSSVSTFKNNKAEVTGTAAGAEAHAYGGAISVHTKSKDTTGSVTSSHSSYINNSASSTAGDAKGGAIYGEKVTLEAPNTFTNNSVSSTAGEAKGGAIYGENVNVGGTSTFTGNTANGVNNDIHAEKSVTFTYGTHNLSGGVTTDEGGTMKVTNTVPAVPTTDVYLNAGSITDVSTLNMEKGTLHIDTAGGAKVTVDKTASTENARINATVGDEKGTIIAGDATGLSNAKIFIRPTMDNNGKFYAAVLSDKGMTYGEADGQNFLRYSDLKQADTLEGLAEGMGEKDTIYIIKDGEAGAALTADNLTFKSYTTAKDAVRTITGTNSAVLSGITGVTLENVALKSNTAASIDSEGQALTITANGKSAVDSISAESVKVGGNGQLLVNGNITGSTEVLAGANLAVTQNSTITGGLTVEAGGKFTINSLAMTFPELKDDKGNTVYHGDGTPVKTKKVDTVDVTGAIDFVDGATFEIIFDESFDLGESGTYTIMTGTDLTQDDINGTSFSFVNAIAQMEEIQLLTVKVDQGNLVLDVIGTNTVPEPTTWALLVLGGLGIFGVARKNRKAKK